MTDTDFSDREEYFGEAMHALWRFLARFKDDRVLYLELMKTIDNFEETVTGRFL